MWGIFVHDYNSLLRGVKRIVKRYEDELGKRLYIVPLCDVNGTLAIAK